MRDAALAILMRAIECDGILRVPIDRAGDPAILELVSLGFILPIETSGAPELHYRVQGCFKRASEDGMPLIGGTATGSPPER